MLVHVIYYHGQKEIYNSCVCTSPCSHYEHYEHELCNSHVSPCSMLSLPAGAMQLPCLYMFHVLITSRSYVTPMLVHVPCSHYQKEIWDSHVGICYIFSLPAGAMRLSCLYMFHILITSKSYVTPMFVHVPYLHYDQWLERRDLPTDSGQGSSYQNELQPFHSKETS